MPRRAVRLLLTVESVRVERVQGITEADAKAEGCFGGALIYGEERVTYHRDAFKRLWDLINAKRAPWSKNDWV